MFRQGTRQDKSKSQVILLTRPNNSNAAATAEKGTGSTADLVKLY